MADSASDELLMKGGDDKLVSCRFLERFGVDDFLPLALLPCSFSGSHVWFNPIRPTGICFEDLLECLLHSLC